MSINVTDTPKVTISFPKLMTHRVAAQIVLFTEELSGFVVGGTANPIGTVVTPNYGSVKDYVDYVGDLTLTNSV